MGLQPNQLKTIAEMIEKETGIVYSEVNYFQLEHRLEEASKSLSFASTIQLFEQFRVGLSPVAKDLLLDLATNNETSFYRDPGIFKALEEAIVPEMIAASPGKSHLKIWSAAASTGQEAYSIAMLFDQKIAEKSASGQPWPDFSLFCSDFSERVLKRVEQGKYSQLEVQRGLAAKLLVQYFDRDEESQWTIKAALRRRIQTRKINLLEPFPLLGTFDIIFCRNVLIYQQVENKKIVIQKLFDLLHPGGVLILGAAESLLGISDKFKQKQHLNGVYFQKP